MTLVRLGYVAMSVHLVNASPSQTVTYKQFSQMAAIDREAALRRLERVAQSNMDNCLRLLKHNVAHDIRFFRLSSRLVPLATHEELADWQWLSPIRPQLDQLGQFAARHSMRLDFHPDHFVLINSPKTEVLKHALRVLYMHYLLLKNMAIAGVVGLMTAIGLAFLLEYLDNTIKTEQDVEPTAQSDHCFKGRYGCLAN
ncbi:hypothetical protein HUR95_01580 [Caldalkalibacillus thermarum TA2.A1]|uniref:UV-endonuclease UvdE n=1 Tax=Caldalkalibacillus thermarum (strain TA2.A1) TaxID=986075 RepID=A0A8X8IAN9_CALTT|nr:hypothetical protein HUR95_01580 [Caldalkalibacillus thermarum TA2.A1]